MKIRWRPGRLSVLCVTAAAVAVAAVPLTPRSTGEGTARAVDRPRVRESAAPTLVVELDRERLKRLQPGKDAAATIAVGDSDDAEPTEQAPGDASVATANNPAQPEVVNAFASKSWYVPPPPPPAPKPVPPPKPTAPPLPFAFVGRYENPGAPVIVLLLMGDRLYTVTEGDLIDATYRVDRVEKGHVELTYLPLKQKQVLPMGEPG